MSEWLSASELEQHTLPGLPADRPNIVRKAQREGWESKEEIPSGGGKPTAYYRRSSLPLEAQVALMERSISASAVSRQMDSVLRAAGEARATERAKREVESLEILASISDSERTILEARQAVISAFSLFYSAAEEIGIKKARSHFCKRYNEAALDLPAFVYEAIEQLSSRTFERWEKRLNERGPGGLVPKHGHRANREIKSHWDDHPEHRQLVEALIYRRGKHVNATLIRQELKAHFPSQTIPHRSTIWRFVKDWTEANQQLADRVTDPSSWKGRHLVAVGRMDEEIVRLAQVWEMDTTPADVLLQYKHPDGTMSTRRYSVIGLIEVYSRMAMLRVVPYESTYGVLMLLRRAILEWRRIPECVRTDQGTAYTSQHFERAMRDLEIKPDLLPPGTPEGKPFIERFFGTFNGGILQFLPGYIGRCVGERKAIEARKKGLERGGLLVKGDLTELPLTKDEFQVFCDAWLDHYSKERVHSTLGRTPFQQVSKWIQQRQPVRGIPEDMVDDYEIFLSMMLAPAPKSSGRPEGVRSVIKGKITIDRIEYTAPEFGGEWNGRQVFVLYDETDISRVFVYTLERKFICIADGLGVPGGVSRKEAARAVKAYQNQFMREGTKELKQQMRDFDLGTAAQRLVEASKERADRVESLPIEVFEHMTPAMEEGLKAAKALKKATTPRKLPEMDEATRAKIAELNTAREKDEEPQYYDNDFDKWNQLKAYSYKRELTNDEKAWMWDFEVSIGLHRSEGDSPGN